MYISGNQILEMVNMYNRLVCQFYEKCVRKIYTNIWIKSYTVRKKLLSYSKYHIIQNIRLFGVKGATIF